jgi:hypothetical protein
MMLFGAEIEVSDWSELREVSCARASWRTLQRQSNILR